MDKHEILNDNQKIFTTLWLYLETLIQILFFFSFFDIVMNVRLVQYYSLHIKVILNDLTHTHLTRQVNEYIYIQKHHKHLIHTIYKRKCFGQPYTSKFGDLIVKQYKVFFCYNTPSIYRVSSDSSSWLQSSNQQLTDYQNRKMIKS